MNDNERFCVLKCRTDMSWILPPAVPDPNSDPRVRDPMLGALNSRPPGRFREGVLIYRLIIVHEETYVVIITTKQNKFTANHVSI